MAHRRALPGARKKPITLSRPCNATTCNIPPAACEYTPGGMYVSPRPALSPGLTGLIELYAEEVLWAGPGSGHTGVGQGLGGRVEQGLGGRVEQGKVEGVGGSNRARLRGPRLERSSYTGDVPMLHGMCPCYRGCAHATGDVPMLQGMRPC